MAAFWGSPAMCDPTRLPTRERERSRGPMFTIAIYHRLVPRDSPMSATKNWLHDYNTALDGAWEALEEAIVKANQLNDLIYSPEGEILARIPGADASLLAAKIRELKTEIDCFANAKEPAYFNPGYALCKVS